MVFVLLIVGAVLLVWPGGLVWLARALRPGLPDRKSGAAKAAARVAGGLLIAAALVLALAMG